MSYTQVIQELKGNGVTLRLHALTHVVHYDEQGNEMRRPSGRFSIEAELNNSGILLEPGAFQYSHGNIQTSVQAQQQGGFLRRALATAGTGESAFATRFQGTGKVWTEPSSQHFILASSNGSKEDDMLLDDKAFYLAQDTMQLGFHTHTSLSGVFSGNGFKQPKLTGPGVFAVESPVPVSEIEVIELDGSKSLTLDGDLMLMYSSSLKVELKPLVRGLRNALRSGEGFVYVLSGRGSVYITPSYVRPSVAQPLPK